MMVLGLIVLLLGAVGVGLVAVGGRDVFAQAVEVDDEGAEVEDAEDAAEGADVAITGRALEQAGAAAIAHMGDGRVTDSEVGDEEGYYEIELTLDDGRQVDVHLDEAFNVLSTEGE